MYLDSDNRGTAIGFGECSSRFTVFSSVPEGGLWMVCVLLILCEPRVIVCYFLMLRLGETIGDWGT